MFPRIVNGVPVRNKDSNLKRELAQLRKRRQQEKAAKRQAEIEGNVQHAPSEQEQRQALVQERIEAVASARAAKKQAKKQRKLSRAWSDLGQHWKAIQSFLWNRINVLNALVLGAFGAAWWLLGPYYGGMFRIPLVLVGIIVFIFMTLDYSENQADSKLTDEQRRNMIGALKASDIDSHFRGFRQGGAGDGSLSVEEQAAAERARLLHEAQLGDSGASAGTAGRAVQGGFEGPARRIHSGEGRGGTTASGDRLGGSAQRQGDGDEDGGDAMSPSAAAAMHRRQQRLEAASRALRLAGTSRSGADLDQEGVPAHEEEERAGGSGEPE